jgi:hypothetical protein
MTASLPLDLVFMLGDLVYGTIGLICEHSQVTATAARLASATSATPTTCLRRTGGPNPNRASAVCPLMSDRHHRTSDARREVRACAMRSHREVPTRRSSRQERTAQSGSRPPPGGRRASAPGAHPRHAAGDLGWS